MARPDILTWIGDLLKLKTVKKNNIVDAINEQEDKIKVLSDSKFNKSTKQVNSLDEINENMLFSNWSASKDFPFVNYTSGLKITGADPNYYAMLAIDSVNDKGGMAYKCKNGGWHLTATKDDIADLSKIVKKQESFTNIDLNTLFKSCFGYCYSCSNRPLDDNGYIDVIAVGVTDCIQKYTAYNSGGIYNRIIRNKVASEWKEESSTLHVSPYKENIFTSPPLNEMYGLSFDVIQGTNLEASPCTEMGRNIPEWYDVLSLVSSANRAFQIAMQCFNTHPGMFWRNRHVDTNEYNKWSKWRELATTDKIDISFPLASGLIKNTGAPWQNKITKNGDGSYDIWFAVRKVDGTPFGVQPCQIGSMVEGHRANGYYQGDGISYKTDYSFQTAMVYCDDSRIMCHNIFAEAISLNGHIRFRTS